MNLIKIKNGLLELDNFYMTSDFGDFLGTGTSHRTTDSLYVTANGKIERQFPYKDFVIKVRKENWENGNDDDKMIFFVADRIDEYGLEDTPREEQHEYLKIICIDNYIQCYVSHDNKEWELVGGENLLGVQIVTQGFRKMGNSPIRLMDYKVFSDPYLTIQNFPENYRIELRNISGEVIKERLFNSEMESTIFLDSPIEGTVKVYDEENNDIFTSPVLNFNHGDVFIASELQLELFYKGRSVKDEDVTEMEYFGFPEVVTVKNISDQTYENLKVSTIIESTDIVELSFTDRDIDFSDSVIIGELKPEEEIDIYVSIKRGDNSSTFVAKDFLFKIE